MGKFIDLLGKQFGRWTVIKQLGKRSGHYYWLCQCSCGTQKEVKGVNLTTKRSGSCGCLLLEYTKNQPKGDKSPSWKRGWVFDEYGYKLVRIPSHHRAKSNGYVREHIVVMEEKLGRRLDSGENVHHINGIKDDNRPENLELWVSSQPPGQRIEDLVDWAREIETKYGKIVDASRTAG